MLWVISDRSKSDLSLESSKSLSHAFNSIAFKHAISSALINPLQVGLVWVIYATGVDCVKIVLRWTTISTTLLICYPLIFYTVGLYVVASFPLTVLHFHQWLQCNKKPCLSAALYVSMSTRLLIGNYGPVFPQTHHKFGDRSFAVARPRLWNSFPISL